MAASTSNTRFRFRDFELDIAAFRLRRNGMTVRLERRPMELLVLLVSNHDRLVPREEIVKRLWREGVIIDFDTGLNILVSKVRQALHDSPDHPACIETVPGKGYRFIAPVESFDAAGSAAPSAPARRRWPGITTGAVLLAAALGLAIWYAVPREGSSPAPGAPSTQSAMPSIAVLAFADMSEEQDQQYFSEGLAEEVLNLLAQSRRLRVIARTSSFSFKGKDTDIATIGEKLNVTHVLEGSVRKSGDRVRITAQLIDTATSDHLWAQTYDRDLTDVLEIQGEIAASVANALQVVLTGGGVATAGTGNLQAHDHFMRGRFFHQRRAPGDLERARQYFERALEIDPMYARAWAQLAGTYWVQTMVGEIPLQSGLQKTRGTAERALALDPTLAAAHFRLANTSWFENDQEAADEHLRKARALEPNDPLVLSYAAGDAAFHGRFSEAAELQRRVVSVDPMSANYRDGLAWWLFYAGRFGDAQDEWLKLLEVDATFTPRGLGLTLVLERRFDEALSIVQPWPDGEDRTQCLALIYHGLGRRAEAAAALARLIRQSSRPFRIAEVYAYRGEVDAAFEWLHRAVERERVEPLIGDALWLMPYSPNLKPLHGDARWVPWVTSARGAIRDR